MHTHYCRVFILVTAWSHIILKFKESEYQEETVLLVEDIQQLHWKSNQHEFEYRGKLYDYKSMRYDHGKPVITCVYDAEEEELLDHFSSQQHHNLLSITFKIDLRSVCTGYSVD